MAIALGSNLGGRERHLRQAVSWLAELLADLAVGDLYESPPAEGASPPSYLNSAVTGLTRLAPEAVLSRLQELERRAGRRRGAAGAPRELDLDLLLYGSLERREPALTLPHPGLRRRDFVLAPLADVAPDWPLPPDGATVAECLRALRPDRSLRRRGWERAPEGSGRPGRGS